MLAEPRRALELYDRHGRWRARRRVPGPAGAAVLPAGGRHPGPAGDQPSVVRNGAASDAGGGQPGGSGGDLRRPAGRGGGRPGGGPTEARPVPGSGAGGGRLRSLLRRPGGVPGRRSRSAAGPAVTHLEPGGQRARRCCGRPWCWPWPSRSAAAVPRPRCPAPPMRRRPSRDRTPSPAPGRGSRRPRWPPWLGPPCSSMAAGSCATWTPSARSVGARRPPTSTCPGWTGSPGPCRWPT